MDREIAPEIRNRRTTRRVLTIGIAAAALLFFFAATIQFLRPSIKRNDVQIARVERGSIDATLQASGTVVPAAEQLISSPVEARVLRIVRRAGDRVHAGDELMELDTTASRLDVDRVAGSIASKESEEAQQRLRLEETLATLHAQIEQKKLDVDIMRYKAEQNERMHREGLVSAQDDLAAATAYKKSQIELTQLQDALIRARRSGAAEVGAIHAQLDTLRKERDQSQRQLTLAMMRADRDGVVTSMIEDAGAVVRRGDIVARIADPSAYRIDATISDIHASRISAGMPVSVRIDDTTSATGTISSIDPRIENGIVKFHVALDDRAHAKLRSNLRVDVFVVTDRRANVLRVKRGSLGQNGEREEIYVVRRNTAVRTPVQWGLAGEQYIEPRTGLREGDEVLISNMSDYEGVKELRLK
jgi:HlyD family secretion protein